MIGQASYELLGNCQIELPSYMTMLTLSNTDTSSDYFGPIIACGFQPGTKTITILTVDGNFYELDTIKFFSIENVGEEVYPILNGQMLEFVRDGMIVTVDADAVLSAAEQSQLINPEIGMSHENKDIDPSQNDPRRNGEKP